jgi:hypothetical protein
MGEILSTHTTGQLVGECRNSAICPMPEVIDNQITNYGILVDFP